jgi:GTP cyclohydrolase II
VRERALRPRFTKPPDPRSPTPPRQTDGGKTFGEPTAIICGQVEGQEDVALRVHDACFTSEVLGSLKCDCAEQLQMAMDYIHANAPGIVIYLWQEGRGIGLANKIAAYKLQEQGLDTVDANRALGLPDDSREYSSVRNILKELGVKSVRLMTNNPRKLSELTELGVKVTGRIPCQIQAGVHNQVCEGDAVRRPGGGRGGGAAGLEQPPGHAPHAQPPPRAHLTVPGSPL